MAEFGIFPHPHAVTSLFLSRSLLATVEFEVAKAAGTETGGLFIAYRENDGTALPVLSCGPGPNADLQYDNFLWDAEHVQSWLFTAARAAERVAPHARRDWLIGRWHKHTLPVVNPSPEDAEGAELLAIAFGQEEIVDLIVACDGHDTPLHFGAFAYRIGRGYAPLETTSTRRAHSNPGET